MKEKQVSILSTLKISFTHLTFIKEDKTYMYSFSPFSLTCLIGTQLLYLKYYVLIWMLYLHHGMANEKKKHNRKYYI